MKETGALEEKTLEGFSLFYHKQITGIKPGSQLSVVVSVDKQEFHHCQSCPVEFEMVLLLKLLK